MTQKREVIYVAGPMTTSGLLWHNLRNVILTADAIFQRGHFPLIPHLSAFHAMNSDFAASLPEATWLEWGLVLLERCDSLFRFPGRSNGTEGEVAHAEKLGKRIYGNINEIPIVQGGIPGLGPKSFGDDATQADRRRLQLQTLWSIQDDQMRRSLDLIYGQDSPYESAFGGSDDE
jgi:hypothetical protein